MRKLCLLASTLLFCAASSSVAQAQHSIKGIVTDAESGAPIASASVHIRGTGIGAYSAADGRFTLNAAPDSAVTLEVRRIGYAPANVPVGADQAEDVVVKMKADVLRLNQQVVTGQATYVARRN
ncbi:MAG TPA: carboxypeptidase-like regulatory domain-containing protein, partial [Gemmatimonadaceae bacterium]|nr:carboxypeptidase-like regulatory domain-containing protein [Gemmatimonadaceae bacterium]